MGGAIKPVAWRVSWTTPEEPHEMGSIAFDMERGAIYRAEEIRAEYPDDVVTIEPLILQSANVEAMAAKDAEIRDSKFDAAQGWALAQGYQREMEQAEARVTAGESGIYEGIDLCELAAEIERVTVTKVIEAVAAIAEERTDGYWSGHANACEEIKYRLQEAWGTPPPAADLGSGA